MRLGIVGGTFDPIHVAHVAMAEAARRCAGLERVLVIPAGVPPHRPQPEAGDQDRLAMCRLAIRGHDELEVSDLELRRAGPSYTVLTLRRSTRGVQGPSCTWSWAGTPPASCVPGTGRTGCWSWRPWS